MFRKISIAFPIIGVTVLIVLSIIFYFYHIEVQALWNTLLVKENSKAEDIYYIVESLIDRDENKLSVLSVALKKHIDLIAGFDHFYKSGGDITPLKKSMDKIFLDMDTDLFQVMDWDNRIIYKTHAPFEEGTKANIPFFSDTVGDSSFLSAIQTDNKWAIISIAPMIKDNELLGTLMVGIWLDNDYAKKIAFETEVHVSLGTTDGIIASSLPFDQRVDIDIETLQKSIQEVKSTRVELKDKLKVIHYSPAEVGDKLFSVMIDIDTKSSHDLLEENRKHIFRLSIIILVAAALLSAGSTLYLVRPLKKLRERAKKAVREISGLDLKETKGNEVQSVILFFNALVTTATSHIAERKEAEEALKKHQEHLEDKINERTSELRKINEKLLQTVAELERRTDETILFSQIGDLLQACNSEDETYSLMERFCKKLFPLESGSFSIFDKAGGILKSVAYWGDDIFEGDEFAPNQCWAVRLGSLHMVKNTDIDPLCPHLKNYSGNQYICAPMIAQGELLGMLHITLNKATLEKTGEEQKELFKSKRMILTSLLEHYAPPLTSLRLRETLKVQSIHDPLTGLFNRRHMQKTLQSEARRAGRHNTSLGIIIIDVDRFKNFNDKYGHEAGDIVLRELGIFFKKCIRQEDIACRYGGEEFILILPETTLEDSKSRAEFLREKIEKEFKIDYHGTSHGITISIGVAAFPEHGPTTDDALNASDKALYKAKAAGRNKVAVA